MSAKNTLVTDRWLNGDNRVGTNLSTDGQTLFMFNEVIGRTMKNGSKVIMRPTENFLAQFSTRKATALSEVLTVTAKCRLVKRTETPAQLSKALSR